MTASPPAAPTPPNGLQGSQASPCVAQCASSSADERQPYSFDGRAYIAGDVRIDGRRELVRALRTAGRDARLDRPDGELFLHSWHAWEERSVDRIIGDFAFAL